MAESHSRLLALPASSITPVSKLTTNISGERSNPEPANLKSVISGDFETFPVRQRLNSGLKCSTEETAINR
jgi:hypothetical protein